MLRVKLKHVDEWNNRRVKVAKRYLTEIAGNHGIVLPYVPDWAEPVWHLFVIRTKERETLQQKLSDKGIQTLIHYPIPPYLSDAYKEYCWGKSSFVISESLADEVLSIPMGPHMTEEQIEYVITNLY